MERGRGEILRERERVLPLSPSLHLSYYPIFHYLSLSLPHFSFVYSPTLTLSLYPSLSLSLSLSPSINLSLYISLLSHLSLFPTNSFYLSLNFYTSPTLSLSFDSLSPYLRISLSILISPSLSPSTFSSLFDESLSLK
jgi:hypothetical protein